LIGLGITTLGGAALGGFVAAGAYDAAARGDCGCQAKDWAQKTNRTDFIVQSALAGAAFGFGFAAAALNPFTAIAAGSFSVYMGLDSIRAGISNWQQNGGLNTCGALQLLGGVGAILGGANLISGGLNMLASNPPRSAVNLNEPKPNDSLTNSRPASSPVGRSRNPLVPFEEGPPRNPPGEIYGRDYSGHAIDRMQERGIPPSAIENAIRYGQGSTGNTPNTTVYYDPVNNLTVVTNSQTGRVVTVREGMP
jgi:filamentous hemagglutinin